MLNSNERIQAEAIARIRALHSLMKDMDPLPHPNKNGVVKVPDIKVLLDPNEESWEGPAFFFAFFLEGCVLVCAFKLAGAHVHASAVIYVL